jgi:hypothetical protein
MAHNNAAEPDFSRARRPLSVNVAPFVQPATIDTRSQRVTIEVIAPAFGRIRDLIDLRHEPIADGAFAVGQDDVREKFFLNYLHSPGQERRHSVQRP